MTKRVFLDIETLPPDEVMRERVYSEVAESFENECMALDPIKISEAAEERFRQLALRGEYGRVLTIGVIIEEGSQIISNGVLGLDKATRRFHLDEARTLRSFWKLLRDFNPRFDCIIGHNVLDFDLLFLYKRSVIKCVRPAVELSFARYRSQPIYDTMYEWEHWGRNKISLDELARVLNLESSKQNGLDGSRVYDYYREGRHEEIADYCKRDVALVREIYYRMKFLGFAAEGSPATAA